MKRILPILVALVLSSCVEAPRGDLSPESAVVITAPSEKEGAAKEVAWIRDNYPGSQVLRVATRPSKEQKVYDVFMIKLADGSRKTVMFEISSFYHK
jgi:hypothetical protein